MELLLVGLCLTAPSELAAGSGVSGFTSDLGGVRNGVLMTAALPPTSAPLAAYLLFCAVSGRNQIRFLRVRDVWPRAPLSEITE